MTQNETRPAKRPVHTEADQAWIHAAAQTVAARRVWVPPMQGSKRPPMGNER